ncbi:MAG: 1-acyl-sn-glycerol-3-phosphate acyltransferase [Actinobacteria bacterium]|nr:1-acyl-sn-glycerol-3-phosphate acyltransferase [Actinomycetota bacterium]
MAVRRSGKRLGFWYRFAVCLLRPGMLALTKRDWRGVENLRPEVRADGTQEGVVVCPNHISWFDPLVSAHFCYDNGRPPRFLGKESVFRVPVAGWILTQCRQIPVYRETSDAAAAVRAAVAAVEAGECVVVYPEGTITRDPGLWPMKGKTGAARIALLTGAPIVPVAIWGAQDVIRPYVNEFRILPRKTMRVVAGEPVDLDDLRGRPLDAAVLAEATDRVISAITALVEQLRGETAPAERFDFKAYQAAKAAAEDDAGGTADGADERTRD